MSVTFLFARGSQYTAALFEKICKKWPITRKNLPTLSHLSCGKL